MRNPRKRGSDAESIAEKWLQKKGLRTVCKNFTSPLGEIDLIMREGDALVFVEVRYRSNSRFGTPAETVGHIKQQRLIRTAQRYLQQLKSTPQCRFDIVAITGEREMQIEWIPNAF